MLYTEHLICCLYISPGVGILVIAFIEEGMAAAALAQDRSARKGQRRDQIPRASLPRSTAPRLRGTRVTLQFLSDGCTEAKQGSLAFPRSLVLIPSPTIHSPFPPLLPSPTLINRNNEAFRSQVAFETCLPLLPKSYLTPLSFRFFLGKWS